ncbi:MBL fold metallo-hydrolase [Pararhodospirillum oryzae]|uniref:MBL fold hydrolase n=2 Tax=Pararhodospirillum oryzae TaxID=478448 RepID=A0A512HBZ5_9PROT|nr:MBL fold hydrolase [Pararhodospirillum oryzae]
MSLSVTVIPVTPFQQNCTLLVCEATRRAALVDPGGEPDVLMAALTRAGVTLERVLLTHGHVDHIGAVPALRRRFPVPVEGPHREDAFWIEAVADQARHFGLEDSEPFEPDRWLVHGDTVQVGEETLQVLHCPGHTPGHVVFFHEPGRLALVGDVLFRGSVGRTDFPRGNHGDLIASIRERLLPLGDDVTFIPGHGPRSTFGDERITNPFIGPHP